MKFGRFPAVLMLLSALAPNAIAGMHGGHFGGSRMAGNAPGGRFAGSPHFHGGHHFDGMNHHHHGHGRAAVFIGLPLFWYGESYPAARPYRPPPTYTYMSQDGSNPAWYYCDELRGYYPDVPACPAGWRIIESGTPIQP